MPTSNTSTKLASGAAFIVRHVPTELAHAVEKASVTSNRLFTGRGSGLALLAVADPVEMEELARRLIHTLVGGENAYTRRSPEERLGEIIGKDIVDLTDSIVRRIEAMASSLLLTGSISYALDDGGVESLVYSSSITPTVPTAKWDAACDPIADLAAACNAIIANSGLLPNVLIMGEDVVTAFLANPKVQAQLNVLHLVSDSIQPAAPTGIGTSQYLGALFRPHLALYSYSEAFEDDSGTLQKMVPDDTCIVGCSNSPATVSYGSISQTEQDGSVHSYSDVRFVPRRLSTPREDKVELRVASRPVLVPFDLTAWKVIQPLTGGGGTFAARSSERDERRDRKEK